MSGNAETGRRQRHEDHEERKDHKELFCFFVIFVTFVILVARSRGLVSVKLLTEVCRDWSDARCFPPPVKCAQR